MRRGTWRADGPRTSIAGTRGTRSSRWTPAAHPRVLGERRAGRGLRQPRTPPRSGARVGRVHGRGRTPAAGATQEARREPDGIEDEDQEPDHPGVLPSELQVAGPGEPVRGVEHELDPVPPGLLDRGAREVGEDAPSSVVDARGRVDSLHCLRPPGAQAEVPSHERPNPDDLLVRVDRHANDRRPGRIVEVLPSPERWCPRCGLGLAQGGLQEAQHRRLVGGAKGSHREPRRRIGKPDGEEPP